MKKKIVFCVSSMQGGGAERVAALLSNFWCSRGYEVVLVVTYSGRGNCNYHLNEKVQIVYLADLVASKNRFKNTIQRLLVLFRLIKNERPTCVVSFLTHVNIAAILACKLLNKKVVVSERIYPPKMIIPWYLNLLRFITYRFADKLVLQTNDGRKWAEKAFPRTPSSVIPNPVIFPVPEVGKHTAPKIFLIEQRKVFLAVGRLNQQKQFDQLIKAFSKIRDTLCTWDLYLIGEGPERLKLEALVKSKKMDNRVFFVGRVGNIGDWYKAADIFVMTSEFEGFPNALIEAMSYGLPVISYDCLTGPRDIINHNLNGILVSPTISTNELAYELETLAGDENLRKRLGENAKKVKKKYAIDKIGLLWDDVMFKS